MAASVLQNCLNCRPAERIRVKSSAYLLRRPKWLSGSGPTDEGVAYLAGCKSLETLIFGVTPNIKGPGLAALKALPNLKALHLQRSGVTDDGLKYLKELKQLTTLDLTRCTRLTGVGFSELKDLNKLTTLDLVGNQLTAEGLKELKELKQLTSLNLVESKNMTEAIFMELQEALPKCKILASR